MRRRRIVRASRSLHDTNDLVHRDITHGQQVLLAENLPGLVLALASLEAGPAGSLRGGETPREMVPQTTYSSKSGRVRRIGLNLRPVSHNVQMLPTWPTTAPPRATCSRIRATSPESHKRMRAMLDGAPAQRARSRQLTCYVASAP